MVNAPPKLATDCPEELLSLFRAVIGSQQAQPFEHQAKAWESILGGNRVYLIAGTASGKSLAVLIPLIYQAKVDPLRRIALLYPTRALLEDQATVVLRIAELCGLRGEVSYIIGGMKRTEVLHALTHRIILATPDALYWFFRKTSKYSALLMYSLTFITDFLLDEAHLMGGLSASNLRHFLEKIAFFREKYLNYPAARLHVLTATPTPSSNLLVEGVSPIHGRSKVGTVDFSVRLLRDRGSIEFWETEINEQRKEGFRRLIVVLNSARKAHQIFDRTREHVIGLPDLPGGRAPFAVLLDSIREFITGGSAEQKDILLSFLDTKKAPVSKVIKAAGSLEWTMDDWDVVLEQAGVDVPSIDRCVLERLESIEGVNNAETWAALWKDLRDVFAPEVLSSLKTAWEHHLVRPGAELLIRIPDIVSNQAVSEWERVLTTANIEGRSLKEWRRQIAEHVTHPYIRFWDTTPMFLYTGGMSSNDRDGMISCFNSDAFEQAIMVSTQAVEAGVDFDADCLLTEESDASAILQRFGRVGRRNATGTSARVILFTSGNTLGRLRDALSEVMQREDFSRVIAECCKNRGFLGNSEYVDAMHAEIFRQIGVSGRSWVRSLPFTERVMRDSRIKWAYGLRGIGASVQLSSGVMREALSVLPLINNKELIAAESPFVLAYAEVDFDTIACRKWSGRIVVDNRSQFNALVAVAECSTDGVWSAYDKSSIPSEILKNGVLLCYGGLPLLRDLRDGWESIGRLERVSDRNGKWLSLPEQWYLLILDAGTTMSEQVLELANACESEVEMLGGHGGHGSTPWTYILDKGAGACVEIYRRAREQT